MSITLSVDAVVLCVALVVSVGGGLAIKWCKRDEKK